MPWICGEAYSERFYQSVEKAEEILKKAFYSEEKECPVVSAIGHTHIDIAWLWTVEQTREKVLRSFSTVLRLMEQYPDYKFMSSQPILYQFVKEQDPQMYEKIRERIREGRWEVDGAMWLESDCNLPAGNPWCVKSSRASSSSGRNSAFPAGVCGCRMYSVIPPPYRRY